MVHIFKSSTSKLGETVCLDFSIGQNKRDSELLKSFVDYLDCGKVYNDKDAVVFKVRKLSDITSKVIPFFNQHVIIGVKFQDFTDWCKVAHMMTKKSHITAEGLNTIRDIKAEMNTGRIVNDK